MAYCMFQRSVLAPSDRVISRPYFTRVSGSGSLERGIASFGVLGDEISVFKLPECKQFGTGEIVRLKRRLRDSGNGDVAFCDDTLG